MMIKLGNIEFQKRSLMDQLKNDMKDDWFSDPLRFQDILTPKSELIDQHISENLKINGGKYKASRSSIFNLPKANFTLRYSLESGAADRVLYNGLVSFLIPYFDPLISPKVFNHRPNLLKRRKSFMFRNGVVAWQEFIGVVKSSIEPSKYLLTTDLSNFFENIDLKKLEQTFLESIEEVSASSLQKKEIQDHIDLLFECLKFWSFNNDRGLPQNRDASSFLANMYMLPIDRKMLVKGYDYSRYMDDIKIVCKDGFEARKAMKDLAILLRERDLSINAKKTEIISGANSERIDQCLETGTDEMRHIEILFRRKTQRDVLKSLPWLKKGVEKLISGGAESVNSREFRFYITKLSHIALCEELDVPDAYFEKITDLIIKSIPYHPSCTDQFVKYLARATLSEKNLKEIRDYLLDEEKSVYSWQNYLLWQLLAQKIFEDDALFLLAEKIVSSGDDTPSRAGATLYIGALGNLCQRTTIAQNFKSLKSFLGQRCGIISCHELERKIIEEVACHIRPDVIGIYKNLKSKENSGTYFAKLERIPLTKLVDWDRES